MLIFSSHLTPNDDTSYDRMYISVSFFHHSPVKDSLRGGL